MLWTQRTFLTLNILPCSPQYPSDLYTWDFPVKTLTYIMVPQTIFMPIAAYFSLLDTSRMLCKGPNYEALLYIIFSVFLMSLLLGPNIIFSTLFTSQLSTQNCEKWLLALLSLSVCLSVCPSVNLCVFFKYLSRKFKFH
jgi:hypothetical protein